LRPLAHGRVRAHVPRQPSRVQHRYRRGALASPHRSGARALETAIASVPAPSYVLEVLEDNASAIALFTAAGFVETRRFRCWTYDRPGAELPAIDRPDLAMIAARANVGSWQLPPIAAPRAPAGRCCRR